VLLLLSVTGRELRLALVLLRCDTGLAVLDGLVVGALGSSASLHGLRISLESLTYRRGALSDGLSNHDNLGNLLNSEGEPVADLLVKLLLAVEGVGSVEKGAGGSDNDAVLAELLDSRLDGLDSVFEVGLPDITTIDNTDGKGLVGAKLANDGVELLGVPDEVDVNSSNVLDAGEDVKVVDNVTKVGGKDKLRQTAAGELLIGRLEGILDLLFKVEDEDRLVNLDVLGASLLQLLEEFDVYGQELLEQRDRVDRLVAVGLTKSKECDGTDKDGTGGDASLLSLLELANGLGVGCELEGLAILEGRFDVVVVGVEPLNHFQTGNIDTILLVTTAHSKVLIESGQLGARVTLRDSVEHLNVIEEVVVESEVVAGDDLDTGILLELPVFQPQTAGLLDEVLL